MNYSIIVKPTFEKEVKRLAKHYASFKADYAALIEELEQNPQTWAVASARYVCKLPPKGKVKAEVHV